MPPVTNCTDAGACYCAKLKGGPCYKCREPGKWGHCGDHEHGCHRDCTPLRSRR